MIQRPMLNTSPGGRRTIGLRHIKDPIEHIFRQPTNVAGVVQGKCRHVTQEQKPASAGTVCAAHVRQLAKKRA